MAKTRIKKQNVGGYKPKKHRPSNSVQGNKWSLLLMVPYLLGFFLFIILPVFVAIFLSFTDFDSITRPNFVFLNNYIYMFTEDNVFMQKVLPNTILFAIIVGPTSFILSFLLAWLLAQIPKVPRTILALLIYSPSLVGGIAMQVVWVVIFNGDANGYLNSFLLKSGFIEEPIQWLQSTKYLFPIMCIVTIWGSSGVGFLSMLSGILNVDTQLYEAAYIDGMKNRFQELIHVTIPSMKPQLLFGAVMAIVNTFQSGAIGVQLSGSNPTPNYSGQLIVNHIEDYGFIKYEMGYASALSFVLLLFIYITSKIVNRILGTDERKKKRVPKEIDDNLLPHIKLPKLPKKNKKEEDTNVALSRN
jgi:multiple sugar transport system permease protein